MIPVIGTCFRRALNKVNARKYCTKLNQPLSANEMPRPGGIPTFMRLPHQNTAEGLDVGIIGIPMDIGTSNRPGTRFGPRQIRTESSLLRACNATTGDQPFSKLQIADLGDIPFTMYDIKQAMKDIKAFTSKVLAQNCTPVTMGGDHTITYPLLQAMKEKYGPIGLVHVDAHADCSDTMMDCKIAHGTPFRRAVEEGLLDCSRVVQIGLRGTTYATNEYQWGKDQGFRIVLAEECWHGTLVPLMDDVRKQMGTSPVYVSLDIDALDPSFAPGTGTPEIAGLTTIQMLEIIRGLKGLNLIGGDLVEPEEDSTEQQSQNFYMVVMDGAAIVNYLRPEQRSTFSDYEMKFVAYLNSPHFDKAQRMDQAFDEYVPASLKSVLILKRRKGSR